MATVTVTITEVRPNLNIEFHKTPTSFVMYIQKYNDVRKRTVYGWTTSVDLLSRIHCATYNSREDYAEYKNDPEVLAHQIANGDYNSINGIVRTENVV